MYNMYNMYNTYNIFILDHNDPSKPSHRLTIGPKQNHRKLLKAIVARQKTNEKLSMTIFSSI